ncbi:hypothetical protein GYMLUDRAFT_71163 [Collybiopsis luxurians FD-317 M1]|nr:hypothetical protein GYMLUDRAFT_71163 [Collybiopsis luxurians FD-317 M1]
MTSTLDACFKEAEHAAQNDLKTRSEELDKEQESISDQQVRYEAEREIQFYDELASDKFAKEAPKIMQTFLSHGETCTQLEAQALSIASKDLSGSGIDYDNMDLMLREYDDVLDRLGSLLMETFELESAILRLTVSSAAPKLEDELPPDSDDTPEHQPSESSSLEPEAPQAQVSSSSYPDTETETETSPTTTTTTTTSSTTPSAQPQSEAEAQPRSQIAPVFSACLPIVRARARNIGMAQQLVEGAKQNLRVTVALESMGIGDGSDWEEDDEDEDDED